MKTFGERLRYLQTDILRMNNVQLASVLGVDKSTVKSIVDTGSTNFKNILPLKKLYNINLNWLLDGDGDVFISPCCKDEKDIVYQNAVTENLILKDTLKKMDNTFADAISNINKISKVESIRKKVKSKH